MLAPYQNTLTADRSPAPIRSHLLADACSPVAGSSAVTPGYEMVPSRSAAGYEFAPVRRSVARRFPDTRRAGDDPALGGLAKNLGLPDDGHRNRSDNVRQDLTRHNRLGAGRYRRRAAARRRHSPNRVTVHRPSPTSPLLAIVSSCQPSTVSPSGMANFRHHQPSSAEPASLFWVFSVYKQQASTITSLWISAPTATKCGARCASLT